MGWHFYAVEDVKEGDPEVVHFSLLPTPSCGMAIGAISPETRRGAKGPHPGFEAMRFADVFHLWTGMELLLTWFFHRPGYYVDPTGILDEVKVRMSDTGTAFLGPEVGINFFPVEPSVA